MGDSRVIPNWSCEPVPPAEPGRWEEAAQQISYRTGFAGKVSAADISNPQGTPKPFQFAYDYTREKYPDWDHLQIVPPFPPYELPAAYTKPSQPIDLGETTESLYSFRRGTQWGIPAPVRERCPRL